MKTMKVMFLICSVLAMAGCGDGNQEWEITHARNGNWIYLAASEVQVREAGPDAGIPDQRLILSSPEVVAFDAFESMTNHRIVIAMPVNFETDLVTGAIRRASLPQFRGKVLPTVVDRKMEFHFLSRAEGEWISTNTLRTRVVSVTYPR